MEVSAPLGSTDSPADFGRIKQLVYARDAGRVFCLFDKGGLIEYDSVSLKKMCGRKVSSRDSTCLLHVADWLVI